MTRIFLTLIKGTSKTETTQAIETVIPSKSQKAFGSKSVPKASPRENPRLSAGVI